MSRLKIFFSGFKQGFRNFFNIINDIINFVLLLLVYIIGIGLVSTISKLSGKHFVDLKASGSSWVARKLGKKQIEEYYKTF